MVKSSWIFVCFLLFIIVVGTEAGFWDFLKEKAEEAANAVSKTAVNVKNKVQTEWEENENFEQLRELHRQAKETLGDTYEKSKVVAFDVYDKASETFSDAASVLNSAANEFNARLERHQEEQF